MKQEEFQRLKQIICDYENAKYRVGEIQKQIDNMRNVQLRDAPQVNGLNLNGIRLELTQEQTREVSFYLMGLLRSEKEALLTQMKETVVGDDDVPF